eukprot:scaffold105327_cov69-Phaeocystis_antarctica.AAC.3
MARAASCAGKTTTSCMKSPSAKYDDPGPIHHWNPVITSGLVDPPLRQQAPAIPHASLRVQHAQLETVRGSPAQPVPSRIHIVWTQLPLKIDDAKRLKNARAQVLRNRQAAGGGHDG